MELAFEDKLLRAVCQDPDTARDELGEEVIQKLKSRLADLRAGSIKDVIIGNPRELDDGSYMIDLYNGYYISFCANHTKNPLLETKKIDWPKVRKIKILKIAKQNE